MKYIDAEKLKAEIERRLAAYQKNFDKADNKIARLSTDGRIASLKALLPFIDSLHQEQSEVDLEKEMDRFFEEMPVQEHENIFEDTYQMIARHFYELGLNAKMREPSLPADIDEAARKYGHEEPILPEGYNDGDIPLYERWTADAFKKGAEWMAGQGVNSEGKVFTSAFTSYVKTPGIEKLLKDAFPEDTEVIVQIRKK